MKVQRVERRVISRGSEDYGILKEYCLLSARLYNRVLYIVRQAFTEHTENIPEYQDLIKKDRFISEYDLSKRMAKLNDEDYRSMPKAQCSQQTIAQVYQGWKGFFAALRKYKGCKRGFLGRPKMPDYKDSYNPIIFPNQGIKIKNGEIWVNPKFKLKGLKTGVTNFQQIRFVVKNDDVIMEIVYFKEIDNRA